MYSIPGIYDRDGSPRKQKYINKDSLPDDYDKAR